MSIEHHPKFAEWEAASEKLADAKRAQARGDGSKLDVSLALMELNKIRDEIDRT